MSRRRGIPEINAGSMADIAFLLLIFFLVTTTMDVDSGIRRKLPPIIENQEIPEINERNIFVVFVNQKNEILYGIGRGTKYAKVSEDEENNFVIDNSLREEVKKFITNFGKNPESSDSPEKAVVSLRNHVNTRYDLYIQVQNDLTKAYNELKNEKSNKDYGSDYEDLEKDDKEIINDFFPVKISEADPLPEQIK